MYYPAALVSMVLGGGMNSRLFTEVREKRGLAYSVGARFDGLEKTGLTRIVAGTQPDRANETLEVVQAELVKLEEDGITADELDLAKTRLKSRVVMNSESTGNRMMAIGRDWWYEQRFRTLAEIRREIDAVDTTAVGDYLSRIHLTDNVGRVAIGPLTASDLGLEPVAFQVS
jgi:predicted Zn-dependent peptidase